MGSTTTYGACPERSRRVSAHYQVDNGVVTKYYLAGASRIAMRKNGTLYYLLGDHLGSTSITLNSSGSKIAELRYKAWGETRYSSGTTYTAYQFTSQRNETALGLYFYNARWYDPSLGRFTSADTLVPGGVQGYDRYAYVRNNPIRYVDPTGHKEIVDIKNGIPCFSVLECSGFQNLSKYTQREKNILTDMMESGSGYAVWAVREIMSRGIHLTFNPETAGRGGGWNPLNPSKINIDPKYLKPGANYYDMLSLIVHETVHVTKGPLSLLTVSGEQEAWRIGFMAYRQMTGEYINNAAARFVALPQDDSINTIRLIRQSMEDYNSNYLAEWLYPWDLFGGFYSPPANVIAVPVPTPPGIAISTPIP